MVGSVVGSGFIVALLNWFKEARSGARQRELSQVQEQLRLLYSPLHCLMSQNARFLRHHEKLLDAYKAAYEAREFSPEGVEASLPGARDTLELMNSYIAELTRTNARIAKVIEDNWSLMDPEDMDLFADFLLECKRVEVEGEAGKSKTLPYEIRRQVGGISYFTGEFLSRIESRWKSKRNRQHELMMPQWPWHRRPSSSRSLAG